MKTLSIYTNFPGDQNFRDRPTSQIEMELPQPYTICYSVYSPRQAANLLKRIYIIKSRLLSVCLSVCLFVAKVYLTGMLHPN